MDEENQRERMKM
jgi:hypothetical protein